MFLLTCSYFSNNDLNKYKSITSGLNYPLKRHFTSGDEGLALKLKAKSQK
ncbi:hypothetical protein QWZ13_12390 [Reinekea marina]|nr:hypothetical protein [Reinekea marina]MDN3649711.1 hypothetical protein [Reinekea marina]